MRFLVTLLLFTTLIAASTLSDDLTAISLTIEQLKEQEKAASKEFHDQLSDAIEANIGKIGEKISGIFTEFNKTHDKSILKNARDEFLNNLANGIGKIKQLKDEVNQARLEAWEANKAKIQQTLADVSTVLSVAKESLAGTETAAPKDLNAAMNRLNGASSWQTASILLMILSIILIATVAVLIIKQMSKSSRAYDKLGGGNNGVFVPTRTV
ncbi:hypothetical protein PFISCL1PPCAC_27274 [Pristionchus fissidentatus]|uniref:Uncharacterized protein n=1 Tax=Pristionchus fissidentatus TaxID=1538716 RepID=A0AAV5WV86_9BILA|nr:hypothetical protein PFISCL1PPCAC_27274 [Pristionchus fissidentatus]